MTKSAIAAKAAATTERSDAGFGPLGVIPEQSTDDKREEPRDVEPGPVREHYLETDQERTGQRGQLQRRFRSRHERRRERTDHEQPLENQLDRMQIGDTPSVVPP